MVNFSTALLDNWYFFGIIKPLEEAMRRTTTESPHQSAAGTKEARALLDAHDGNVRSALTALDQGSAPEEQHASTA